MLQKNGVLNKNFEVQSPTLAATNQDTFAECSDLEDSSDFTDLNSQVQVNDGCSVDDLVQSEEHTPVCSNLADNAWKNLLCRIRHKGKLSQ